METHECALYLAMENIDHTRTEAKSPRTNGIRERFNKTVPREFYQVAPRNKLYRSIAEPRTDLDAWMREHNTVRTHQVRWCHGKTPTRTLIERFAATACLSHGEPPRRAARAARQLGEALPTRAR